MGPEAGTFVTLQNPCRSTQSANIELIPRQRNYWREWPGLAAIENTLPFSPISLRRSQFHPRPRPHPQNGRLLLFKILLQLVFQVVVANLYDIELLISPFDLSLKLLIVDL